MFRIAKIILFDNVSNCLVLVNHQLWNIFQKAIIKEQRKNMWSKECVSVKHRGHMLLSQILALKRLTSFLHH